MGRGACLAITTHHWRLRHILQCIVTRKQHWITRSCSAALFQTRLSSRGKTAEGSLPGRDRRWGLLRGWALSLPQGPHLMSLPGRSRPSSCCRRSLCTCWSRERSRNIARRTAEQQSPLEQCSYLTQQCNVTFGAVLMTINICYMLLPSGHTNVY